MAKKPKDDGAGPAPSATAAPVGGKPYVVLARKYRPRTFDDMIGQDALVQTLRNAFASGRIAQGYMLTGVRGIGKTTTARILARALNYETDSVDAGRPSICRSSGGTAPRSWRAATPTSSRWTRPRIPASTTCARSSRTRATSRSSARYKVFIIDEVHMLSKNAFNGLLKTLEEPPEHVKFIFATTEIRKVPVTVLSRCQRFDLRRIDVPVLVKHFQKILAEEGASAEDEALRLIARAAEGSRARRVVDPRSGDRDGLGRGQGRRCARHARPCRSQPRVRSGGAGVRRQARGRSAGVCRSCMATAPNRCRCSPISAKPCI